jgi:hypothetical protein
VLKTLAIMLRPFVYTCAPLQGRIHPIYYFTFKYSIYLYDRLQMHYCQRPKTFSVQLSYLQHFIKCNF